MSPLIELNIGWSEESGLRTIAVQLCISKGLRNSLIGFLAIYSSHTEHDIGHLNEIHVATL